MPLEIIEEIPRIIHTITFKNKLYMKQNKIYMTIIEINRQNKLYVNQNRITKGKLGSNRVIVYYLLYQLPRL